MLGEVKDRCRHQGEANGGRGKGRSDGFFFLYCKCERENGEGHNITYFPDGSRVRRESAKKLGR